MTYPATWKLVWKHWNKQDYGKLDEILNRKCSRTLKAQFFWSRKQIKNLGDLKLELEGRIEELQVLEGMENGLTEEQDRELRQKAGELIATLARLATWWR